MMSVHKAQIEQSTKQLVIYRFSLGFNLILETITLTI